MNPDEIGTSFPNFIMKIPNAVISFMESPVNEMENTVQIILISIGFIIFLGWYFFI